MAFDTGYGLSALFRSATGGALKGQQQAEEKRRYESQFEAQQKRQKAADFNNALKTAVLLSPESRDSFLDQRLGVGHGVKIREDPKQEGVVSAVLPNGLVIKGPKTASAKIYGAAAQDPTLLSDPQKKGAFLQQAIAQGVSFEEAKQEKAAGAAPTTKQKEYEMARGQGYKGSFMDYQKALKTKPASVNVSVGGNRKAELQLLKMQYELNRMQQEYAQKQLTNPLEAEKLKAGIAKTQVERDKLQFEQESKALKQQLSFKKELRSLSSSKAQASLVLDHIKEARRLAEDEFFATGYAGAATKKLKGPARALENKLKSIRASAVIDAMLQLKRESATGATGFGALSEKELLVLQDRISTLDPLSPDFLQQLELIEDSYQRVISVLEGQIPEIQALMTREQPGQQQQPADVTQMSDDDLFKIANEGN